MEVPHMIVSTLSDLLHEGASKWPERVAVSDAAGDRAMTYRDLATLVAELTARLHRQGVGQDDVAAIVSDNCLEFVLALFAVVGAGAAAAPLNPDLPTAQIISRLHELRADATIVPAHLHSDFVATHGAGAGLVWTVALAPDEHQRPGVELVGPPVSIDGSKGADSHPRGAPLTDQTALLLMTSGTTAVPKVVALTHGNLLASIEGIRTGYRLTPADATVLVMPLHHGHGLIASLLATLASGGAAYLPTGGRFHAGSFWSDMVAARATWYSAVPTIHQILLARAGTDPAPGGVPNLRFVRSCSAALAPAVLGDLETTFGAPVLQAYGMTEAAHQVSSNPLPSDGPAKAASVGLTTGVEIRIAAPGGGPVASGTTGEVWIRGPAVTTGYVDDDAASAESFTDGWFRTGDLGYQDADGYLFLIGRIKDLINRGGEKISPTAVDNVLLSNPAVEDALSFGVPDEKYGEEIEAAVVLRPGSPLAEDELKRYARSKLSAFEVPARIFFVTDLPRTGKGAGDRRRLAAQLGRRD
jgi:acyl-CoA synthetase (AMP-forming)/AMP-acid ligase II